MRPVIIQHEAKLPKQDPRYVNRIVGYNEYRQALEYLDTLIRRSNPDELKAIDDFIKTREEFTVYTNLSRQNQLPTSLAEPGQKPEDDFARRGLAWITALARVEVGAMLAGFTDQTQPFLAVHPSKFDMEEYKELLLDGLRTHYFALRSDPSMRDIKTGRARDRQNLAYGRRVHVTNSFMETLGQLAGTSFSPQQVSELASWKKDLDNVYGTIVKNIVREMLAASDQGRQSYEALVMGCPSLVAGVRQESISGTATIRPRQ